MTVTVIIVTLNRPDCVRRCLTCLVEQRPPADQLIVVDASQDDRTRDVVAGFVGVTYLRNANGYGRMTASRNMGLLASTGDIVAFLDDDAFAHEGWLENLVRTYREHPEAGAVGGRALNSQPNEAEEGVDRIGTLTRNGILEGWFAADPKRVIAVDHMIGCNMSFRRDVLVELGGFREDYPGISGVREDSDMCVRVRRAGHAILFNPAAVATHIGAPQASGKRFDVRYAYYSARNHAVLLVRNFGPTSPMFLRYLARTTLDSSMEFVRKVGGAVLRVLAIVCGTVVGMASGLWLLGTLGRDPKRRDEESLAIRKALEANARSRPLASSPQPEPATS